jgi:hypothetical protein
MEKKTMRPIKLLLPGELVERMDGVLQQGMGGFRTRHSLVEEAIEYYLQELQELERDDFALAPPLSVAGSEAPASKKGPVVGVPPRGAEPNREPQDRALPPSLASLERNPPWVDLVREPSTIEETAISYPLAKATVSGDADVSTPDRSPILGLHNRDWPTLKALELLGEMTNSGPVLCSDFYDAATASGWMLGDLLKKYESKGAGKLSALLPGNREKAKAAESNYRSFALGWIKQSDKDQAVKTSGPIFSWSAAGLTWQNGELHIGLTESGASLLAGMSGLMPTAPHPEDKARFFLSHISEFGPDDWLFFRKLLSELSSSPTRIELVATIVNSQQSTESVAASLVQGYVARGREWGLVEQQQQANRYALTPFGKDQVSDLIAFNDGLTHRKVSL